MPSAHLVVNPSTISFHAAGPITGDVVLLLDGFPFPTSCWNDFVVVVVDAWVRALVRLATHASTTERVHFMEGPYVVDLVARPEDQIRIEGRGQSGNQLVVEVQSRALFEDAAVVAGIVLEACAHVADGSADVERLASALGALRAELRRLSR